MNILLTLRDCLSRGSNGNSIGFDSLLITVLYWCESVTEENIHLTCGASFLGNQLITFEAWSSENYIKRENGMFYLNKRAPADMFYLNKRAPADMSWNYYKLCWKYLW